MSAEEIQKLNSVSLDLGLNSLDYKYWKALLEKIPSEEKASENYLGKRLVESKLCPGPSLRAPLSYKYELTKKLLSNDEFKVGQASILNFGFDDYYSKISAVETNAMFKIVLLGTTKGKIKCVYLSKPEDGGQNEGEEGLAGTGEKIDPELEEDFEVSLNCFEFLGHKNIVSALSLSPDSTLFVSGSVDGEIRLWNTEIRCCLRICSQHLQAVLTLKMSPKGAFFLSGGVDATICLWNHSSGTANLTKEQS